MQQACLPADLHAPWIEPRDTPGRFAQYLARIRWTEHAGFLVIDRADGGLADFININEIMLGAFASGYLGYAAFAGKAGCGLMGDGLAQVVGIASARWACTDWQPTSSRPTSRRSRWSRGPASGTRDSRPGTCGWSAPGGTTFASP